MNPFAPVSILSLPLLLGDFTAFPLYLLLHLDLLYSVTETESIADLQEQLEA